MDLPSDLLRQAKIAAVEEGTTLRELVGRALARELGLTRADRGTSRRASFPIFASRNPGRLNLTAADLRKLDEEEDRRRHGRAR